MYAPRKLAQNIFPKNKTATIEFYQKISRVHGM